MPDSNDKDPSLLSFVATTVESNRDRIDGLETRMGGLENRVEAGFEAVRGDIERVHVRLDSIERILAC